MALLLEDYLRCPKCGGIWEIYESETNERYTAFICHNCNRAVRIHDPVTVSGMKVPLTCKGREHDRRNLVDVIFHSLGMEAKHLCKLA